MLSLGQGRIAHLNSRAKYSCATLIDGLGYVVVDAMGLAKATLPVSLAVSSRAVGDMATKRL